jgi:hypothetical protein
MSIEETIAELSTRVTALENAGSGLVSQSEFDTMESSFATMESKLDSFPQLTSMTVTDSEGHVAGLVGEIVPLYSRAAGEDAGSPIVPNPYMFYAAETIASAGETIEAKEVQIALPIGGSLSGLYRFPRVGERILVAETDEGNYLMGYLASSTLTPFLDDTESGADNIAGTLEEKGEVLRYETPGYNLSEDSSFSEIGFYSHEADWPIKNSGEFVYTDEAKTELYYPRIDRIKIQSTGDIRSTAENHHLIRAKRFEVLAGCPEVNHRTDTTADGERPLGDNLGDDSALHGGDVHVRAANRVVIKADQEIILQVGRTVLSLSDEGFTVKSKVTNSNFENVMDATLGLSPRDGINMFGYNVNVSSAKGFQLGDSYGGSISSTIGVVGVNGREVKLTAYDAMEYAFTTLYALFQFIQCSASGGAALDGAEDVNTAQYVNFTFDMVQRIIEVVKNVYEGYQARQQTKEIEDEKAKADAAQAELARAREEAEQAQADLDGKADKLAQDKQDAADAAAEATKAREDADAKAAAAREAAAKEEQANAKLEADRETERKAQQEQAEAETKANQAKAEAAEADAKAKAAKEQAESDATAADSKKKDAEDAKEAADKAQKTVEVDERQVEALNGRVEANEESAKRHEEAAADAKAKEAKHLQIAGTLEDALGYNNTQVRQPLEENIAKLDVIINDPGTSKKEKERARKEKEQLQARLDRENQRDALNTGRTAFEVDAAKMEREVAEKEAERAKSAQESADQKRQERDEKQQQLDRDRDAANQAKQDADTKKSESEAARDQAKQSKADAEAAESDAQTKRKNEEDAQKDLDQKDAAKKAAEENAQKSKSEADSAADDALNKTAASTEAERDAAAKEAASQEKDTAVQEDQRAADEAKARKEAADATLKEKEEAAAAAQKAYEDAVSETKSSALTDEFDQAIDIEGEKVHYEDPDYKPPEDTPKPPDDTPKPGNQ